MEVRAHSQPSSSSKRVAIAPSRYFEFETADRERKRLGGRGIGGGGKSYRKQWKWVDAGDGIRVAVAVVVRERVQEGGRKRAVAAAERRGTSEAATNGKGKRKPKGPEEGGRPSAGGPDRCGARRGQSAAA
jgi:hypothetical protein